MHRNFIPTSFNYFFKWSDSLMLIRYLFRVIGFNPAHISSCNPSPLPFWDQILMDSIPQQAECTPPFPQDGGILGKTNHSWWSHGKNMSAYLWLCTNVPYILNCTSFSCLCGSYLKTTCLPFLILSCDFWEAEFLSLALDWYDAGTQNALEILLCWNNIPVYKVFY